MSRIGTFRIDLFAGTSDFVEKMKRAEGSVNILGARAQWLGNQLQVSLFPKTSAVAKSITDLGKLAYGASADFGAFGLRLKTGVSTELAASRGLFDKASAAVLNLRTAFVAITAAVGAYKLVGGLNQAAELIDNLGKKSKTLGIPIQQLSILRFTAQEAGVDFDTLAGLVSKAQKNIGSLTTGGTSPAAAAFQTLGIKLRDSDGRLRSISDLLPEIGDSIQELGAQSQKISLASEIFGKEGGPQFVQLLEDVDGQFSKMILRGGELAGKVGAIYNDEQFQRLKEYNDAISNLGFAAEGVAVKISSSLAPALTQLANTAALRLAEVPSTTSAIIAAYSTALGGGNRSDEALKDLQRVKDAVENLLVDGGLAAGKALVITAASGLFAAAGAIGLQLAKGFKNSVFGDSRDKQLQSLLQRRSELLKNRAAYASFDAQAAPIQAQIDALNSQSDAHPSIRGFNDQKVAELLGQLSKLRAEFNLTSHAGYEGAANIDAAIATYDTKIKALQKELEVFQAQEAANLSSTVDAAIGRAAPSIEHLRDVLHDRLNELGAALDQVKTDFNTDFVGPPAPVDDSLKQFREQAEAEFNRLKEAQAAATDAAEADWGRYVKAFDIATDELKSIQSRGAAAKIGLATSSGGDLATQQLRERLKLQQEQRQELEKLADKLQELGGTDQGKIIWALYGVQSQETQAVLAQQAEARTKAADQIRAIYDPRVPLLKDLKDAQFLRDSGALSQDEFSRYAQAINNKIQEIETGLANFGDQLRDTIKGWASDASDAFGSVATGAKVNFGEILRSWEKTLISMTAKQYLFQPFFNAIGNFAGSLFGATPTVTGAGGQPIVAGGTTLVGGSDGLIRVPGVNLISGGGGSISGNARGNAIIGGIQKFAAGGGLRGIINDTVIFPMRNGKIGAAGEAGTEYAVEPVRMPNGNLGVRAVGGQSGVTVNVIDQRSSGAAVETRQRQGSDGSQIVDVFVRDAVGRMAKDGSLDKLLGQGYGIRRKPLSR